MTTAIPKCISELQRLLSNAQVLTDQADCWVYGYDYSRRQKLPDAVVFPTEHEQVENIVQLCNEYQVPLIARGGASGATGGTVPTQGGIVLSLEKMNKILHMDADNRLIIVQSGVLNKQVQDTAAKQGFCWAPDPTSYAHCMIGGNLAVNAAGPRAIKYGTCRENTLALKAVLGTGQSIYTGAKTTKSSVGYDFTRLLIGSEGTLGIITEATLKLLPLAKTKRTLQASFNNIDAATEAVIKIMQQSTVPYSLEFMDHACLDIVRDNYEFNLPENAKALLMIETDGDEQTSLRDAEALLAIIQIPGLISSTLAQSEAEVQALWQIRKSLAPALRRIAPNKINEDVVVPVAQLGTLIQKLAVLSKQYDIPIVNFGHAGNGNIHVNLLLDSQNPDEASRAQQCLDKVFDLVMQLQGSLSGEHGIGLEKKPFITKELSETNLSLMRAVKEVFDPNKILNPDKVFNLS